MIAGDEYYFAVDNWNDDRYSGKFRVCLTSFGGTENNDNKENAYLIEDINNYCSGLGDYSNLEATGDGPKPSCWTSGPYHNVWFKFVATSTGMVDVRLKTGDEEGTMVSPNLALWDASGSVLDCRNQSDGADISIENDALTPGSTYYISVDNFINGGGKSGTFTLCVNGEPSSGISLNFQALTKTDFTVNASGITEEITGTSGDAGEIITISPTAPEAGNTANISIHVAENSNPAGNNAAMDLKVVYNSELNVTEVILVDGENEQILSTSFYEVIDGKNLVFKGEEVKKPLFPITTNLQGVVYNETEGNFTVTLFDPNLFSVKKLRVIKDGSQVTEISTVPLRWIPSGSPDAGLYHFELDLEPITTGGVLQTFKGQFLVKE